MIPGWLDSIEEEVVACLCTRGSLSARELSEALEVSEACAVSYISLLASAGHLTIERVSLPVVARRDDDGVLAGAPVDRPGRTSVGTYPLRAA